MLTPNLVNFPLLQERDCPPDFGARFPGLVFLIEEVELKYSMSKQEGSRSQALAKLLIGI